VASPTFENDHYIISHLRISIMIEFSCQEIMCSNGYIININKSNILVKMYKYMYNKLYKLHVIFMYYYIHMIQP